MAHESEWYTPTHISVRDGSDAMKLLASQDGHILLVNEDGYTWIDSADQWQEVASEDG